MKNCFALNTVHTVVEANINYYSKPFVHPKRKMAEHDFIYVLDGEWEIGQNDEKFLIKKDSLLILSANNTHYGIAPCLPNTKTMYFHVIDLPQDSKNDCSNEKVYVDSHIYVGNNKNIKRLFYEIVNNKQLGFSSKSNFYFQLLLCELDGYNQYNDETDVAYKIQKIIHRNPERFFSNKELASAVGVSVKTAENKFKTAFSSTIHQYILEFKIKEAIEYFDTFPKISIKETAYNLGFYDEYHFSKQFKKITGFSPMKFRNK